MSTTTAKYILKSDRTKTVDVVVPVFTYAKIIGADGKETEVSRTEFEQNYEPVLAKTTAPSDTAPPASTTAAFQQEVLGALARIEEKVDAIHAAVVPHEGQ